MIAKEQLISDLKHLGVCEGDILNIKVSYKSIGEIDGGIKTFIEALLDVVGKNGTIFTDSFVRSHTPFELFFSPTKCIVDENTKSYAGYVANALIKHPNAKRSPHPIQKFVAVGANADIVLNHKADSEPYSTLYEIAQLGAKNIRIGAENKVVGVGTTHVAIDKLKWKQKIAKNGVIYIEDGKKKTFYGFWPNACKIAFNNMLPLHRKFGGIINEGKVGKADAVLSDMKKTLDIELTLGKQYPYFLKCEDPTCFVCRLEWQNSHGSVLKVLFNCVKQKNIRSFAKTILWIFSKHKTKNL